jgi:hypothetical protein
MKLPAYKQDKTLATKVNSREKSDLFRKYNVVNYTLYRFKIDKVIPSPIKSQIQFQAIKNTIPDKELNKMLNDSYTLLQEIGGEYVPYKLPAENGKMFTPTFNSSDLILVPPNSTGFNVTPTTQQIEKLNTYNVVRKDPVLKETTAKVIQPKTTTNQVAERMTTRSKSKTPALE